MLHTIFEAICSMVPKKKVVNIFTINEHDGLLGHVTRLINLNFHSHEPISFLEIWFQIT